MSPGWAGRASPPRGLCGGARRAATFGRGPGRPRPPSFPPSSPVPRRPRPISWRQIQNGGGGGGDDDRGQAAAPGQRNKNFIRSAPPRLRPANFIIIFTRRFSSLFFFFFSFFTAERHGESVGLTVKGRFGRPAPPRLECALRQRANGRPFKQTCIGHSSACRRTGCGRGGARALQTASRLRHRLRAMPLVARL